MFVVSVPPGILCLVVVVAEGIVSVVYLVVVAYAVVDVWLSL